MIAECQELKSAQENLREEIKQATLEAAREQFKKLSLDVREEISSASSQNFGIKNEWQKKYDDFGSQLWGLAGEFTKHLDDKKSIRTDLSKLSDSVA